ncbi:MAG: rRNA maturation RNase YbeY [Flavobacteriales bacterium]|nr:rRNA maturation RNase YbeY [Flavobacteriales bacterium]
MIYYHSEDIRYEVKNKLHIRKWITDTIINEGLKLGDINYIICSDEYLLKLNRSSLDHDYYTDIITFDYCENGEVSGDLFISIDRVLDNSRIIGSDFIEELHRVMIHGVLHLCGYKDKTKKDEETMRKKEDYYLNLRSF